MDGYIPGRYIHKLLTPAIAAQAPPLNAVSGRGLKQPDRYQTPPTGEFEQAMKLIIAIIQPSKLEDVKAALSKVEVVRLTIMDVQGFGRQKGHTELYRGAEYVVDFLPKTKLEVAVAEGLVDSVVDAISKAAHSGKIGDGKIFVSALEQVIRIRTGETGEDAL